MQDEDYLDLVAWIKECLESTYVAILATSDNSEPWSTPVYFTYDDKFNFYFMSETKTRHIKEIEKNPNVSLAIFMPSASSFGFKVGLQIGGIATFVPDEDIEEIYMKRSMRLTGTKGWNKESMGGHLIKQAGWTFVKVTPKSINYTDRRYFSGATQSISIKKLIENNKGTKI